MKILLYQVQELGPRPGLGKPVNYLAVTWAGHPSLTGQIMLFKENSLRPVHIIYESRINTANQAKDMEPDSSSYLPHELWLLSNSEPQRPHL